MRVYTYERRMQYSQILKGIIIIINWNEGHLWDEEWKKKGQLKSWQLKGEGGKERDKHHGGEIKIEEILAYGI